MVDGSYWQGYEIDCRDKEFLMSDTFKAICHRNNVELVIVEVDKAPMIKFWGKCKEVTMEYNKKFELVGQIEGVLNKMCFAYDSDCHGCPCYTNDNGVCELEKAVINLHVILSENKYEVQNETLD